MSLKRIYNKLSEGTEKERNNFPVISFEIYPPKDDIDGSKLDKLVNHLDILKKFNPAFISLTYGAGGTTQTNSLEIIKRIKKDLELNIMPHFTCVNTSKAQVENYLREIQALGIQNILALRGDIPAGTTAESFDFHYANELVEFIKAKTDLSIGVAGYPEGHINCPDLKTDMENLKRKVDAGAEAVYTQMFFDNEKYFKFVDFAQKSGIEIPIIPGVLAIRNFGQLEKMLTMAKVSIPKALMQKLEKHKDNSDYIKKLGIEFASNQCQKLIEAEVAGLHFFTLNTSSATSKILDNLLS